MVFFSQKVLRKIPGNWTFVIVTDREDLDGQIYRNFANTGAVLEDEKRVRADSGESLKRMLNQEDHRYVFTLIQKFHTEHGEKYPELSERSDIIVITDEAHRSQYDIFARNMRSALPNAAFIGFTGTPLMAGEETTKEVFGDYVFDLQLQGVGGRSKHRPAVLREPHPRTSADQREPDRGHRRASANGPISTRSRNASWSGSSRGNTTSSPETTGLNGSARTSWRTSWAVAFSRKAMVISIDKATAVRTFDKVQKHWKTGICEVAEGSCRCRPDATGRNSKPAEVLRGNRYGRGGLVSRRTRSKSSRKRAWTSPRTASGW